MPKLFGKTIDTDPCAMEAEVRLNNLKAALHKFRRAAIGDGIGMSFRLTGRVRFLLLAEEASGATP